MAALLNITTSADATVEVLKSQINPPVKELLSKPIPHPKSHGIRSMLVRRPVPMVNLDKDKSMEAEMPEKKGGPSPVWPGVLAEEEKDLAS